MECKTNDFVQSIVATLVGHLGPLLARGKLYKLVWFSHFIQHDTLEGG